MFRVDGYNISVDLMAAKITKDLLETDSSLGLHALMIEGMLFIDFALQDDRFHLIASKGIRHVGIR